MTWESGWSLRALAPNKKSALGLALIALGVLGILWGVFHVLGALPEHGLDFAHRNTDYEDRKATHGSFPGGFARAMLGLGLVIVGARLRQKSSRPTS
jgi:hypothetical protein